MLAAVFPDPGSSYELLTPAKGLSSRRFVAQATEGRFPVAADIETLLRGQASGMIEADEQILAAVVAQPRGTGVSRKRSQRRGFDGRRRLGGQVAGRRRNCRPRADDSDG